jgi:hypothetical protein
MNFITSKPSIDTSFKENQSIMSNYSEPANSFTDNPADLKREILHLKKEVKKLGD